MKSKFVVKKDYHDTRFDRWFRHNVSDLPQSLIEKLIRKNKIKVNKKKTKTKYRVQSNDEIYFDEDLNIIDEFSPISLLMHINYLISF